MPGMRPIIAVQTLVDEHKAGWLSPKSPTGTRHLKVSGWGKRATLLKLNGNRGRSLEGKCRRTLQAWQHRRTRIENGAGSKVPWRACDDLGTWRLRGGEHPDQSAPFGKLTIERLERHLSAEAAA